VRITESHVARAAIATSWNYSSRLVGLGWTAILISKLSISDYGMYAIGIAAAAIIYATTDNAFFVRSLRVNDDRFQRERCARVLFGVVVAVAGVFIFPIFYVAGFATIVAGGEILFNAFKSQYYRAARPDVAMRFDAARQFASIGLAAAYLLVTSHPQLSTATALYVAPYGLIMLACLRYVPGRAPAAPGDLREISILSAEACAAAIYVQGDLLVLGLIAGETVTGYYSVALVTATAISLIGQQYATTFVEHLRASGGDLKSAPKLVNIAKVALLTGCAMAATGVGILIWGRADSVGYLALIMSLWTAARAVEYNFVVVLYTQHRDGLRVRATATAAVVKVALLFPTVYLVGAYGAAVVGLLCEIALISVYYRALYAPRQPADVAELAAP
jgi:O-antigen/teichoic acid export membrane protein